MEITWKYSSPISDEQIDLVEKSYAVRVPKCLREIIKIGNNGYPSKNKFDTKCSKGHMFKTLLSYLETDVENVFTAFFSLHEAKEANLLPFANDPAGNLICLRNSMVVLWNHETCIVEEVSDSVEDFFEHLYY